MGTMFEDIYVYVNSHHKATSAKKDLNSKMDLWRSCRPSSLLPLSTASESDAHLTSSKLEFWRQCETTAF